MKKSELRKIIRRTISEQFNNTPRSGGDNPMCNYCLSEAIDTGITTDWSGNSIDPIVGPGPFQAPAYNDPTSPMGSGPAGCITLNYGYEIWSNGGPMFGSFYTSTYDNCQYSEHGYNCRPGHISGTSKCVPGTVQSPGQFASLNECIASGCEEQQNNQQTLMPRKKPINLGRK